MHDNLFKRIHFVARRLRAVRRWRLVTAVATVAVLVGLVLLGFTASNQRSGYEFAVVLLAGTVVSFIVVAVMAQSSFRDPRLVASQIEQRFPSLDQRLLTALSQSGAGHQRLGYLQRRVISEVADHAQTHRWTDVVSRNQLWLSRLSGVSATALLTVVLALLFQSKPAREIQAVAAQTTPAWEVVIEPGDTEVERGSSLVITARFVGPDADTVPSEAELVCMSADGSERKVELTRNLVDPVLGGFVASVNDGFTYQVVGSDWRSESHTVGVFEYPSVVRSDANLDYPEYTGLPDKRVDDTVRVSAVEGTKVKWICFVNKAISLGELVTKDGTRIALQNDPETPKVYSAEIDLKETQRYSVELTDEAGRRNQYPPELVTRMLTNQPPSLKLAVTQDVAVSPLEELPLAAEVRDDYGIAEVGLTYVFADRPRQDITLASTISRGEKKEVDHLVAFEDLGAEPDQLLSYHFWADDFGPDGQLRRTESDLYFAEVRPFDEIFREGEPPPGGEPSPPSENAQQAEELAELQKQIINATWTVVRKERGDAPSDDFANNILLISESQAEAIEKLEGLAAEVDDPQSQQFIDDVRKHMQLAFTELTTSESDNRTDPLEPAMGAEQAAYGALLKLRAREFQVTQSQRQQPSSSSSSSAKQRQKKLDDLELKQDENRYEMQQQAQSTGEEQEQREVRQVLNRLRELARRQEDLNKELAQLQSALEQAETEDEKEEVERQLKRLRDQEQNLLRATDELSERMQQPENQESMQEASETLEQTRENVRRAAEALNQEDAAEALTSGKRAEREFQEMRDEFRQRAAGEFNDAVREMRNAAQELEQQQDRVAEQLEELDQESRPGLRGESQRDEILETLENQRQSLGELLQNMQETVEEAEDAEPLLAKKLYDSYRKARQQQVDKRLQETSELLDRGFDSQARDFQREAGESIVQLRKDLEDAAESVLGNESDALQRALDDLEQLSNGLDEEIKRSNLQARGPRDRQNGETLEQQENSQQRADSQSGQSSGDNQGQGVQPMPSGSPSESGSQGTEQSPAGQASSQPPQSGGQGEPNDQGKPSSQGKPSEVSASSQANRPNQEHGEGGGLSQYAANRPGGSPMTGDGFQEWSDRLRDVEEMVEDPELRSQAARIRDRAREVRIEFRRNSKEPNWTLVEEMIAQPLRELKRDVAEELMRRSAENQDPVPIDRDPVPAEFTEAVRKYYESLGSGR